MHVKYKAALRQALPEDIIRLTEAADLVPSTTNCIRGALDAQEALVEATMANFEELASKGFPSAAAVLGSFHHVVWERAMCNEIKSGALKVGLGVAEAVCGVSPCRPSHCRPATRSVGAKRQPQAQPEYHKRDRRSTARGRRRV